MTDNKFMLEAFSLCEVPLQKYIAYLLNVEEISLFEPTITNEVVFQDGKGIKWHLKFALVKKDYMFDIEKCNYECVRTKISEMIRMTQSVYMCVRESLSDELKAQLANTQIATDPGNTTLLAYSSERGEELKNKEYRIGFVWA